MIAIEKQIRINQTLPGNFLPDPAKKSAAPILPIPHTVTPSQIHPQPHLKLMSESFAWIWSTDKKYHVRSHR
jgi:hypothetical protein